MPDQEVPAEPNTTNSEKVAPLNTTPPKQEVKQESKPKEEAKQTVVKKNLQNKHLNKSQKPMLMICLKM